MIPLKHPPEALRPQPWTDAKGERLARLKQDLAGTLIRQGPAGADLLSLGLPRVDTWLGGGIRRGALHEVYADSPADLAAATGFVLGLALRAARTRPVIWVRQDWVDAEAGYPYAPGLAALGMAPSALVIVRAGRVEDVLKAADDAARCAALGALVIEPWGASRQLDLTASRRLGLAARAAGMPSLMLRVAAEPVPSAAMTRWSVKALTSHPLEASSPGHPAFEVRLVRHREGRDGEMWRLEWNRDRACFEEQPHRLKPPAGPALSRPVAPLSADGSAHAGYEEAGFRLAG